MRRISFMLITAAALLIGAAPTSAGSNGKLDEILANMQRSAGSIKTIQANMDQLKRYRDIGGREKHSGEIFFKHVAKGSDKVKIAYSAPRGQAIWVVGETITLYQAEIKQAIVTTRAAAASKGDEFSFVATPYASVPELKRQYNIVYAGDDQGLAKLELTPKRKSSVQKLTLWVDQSSWLPVKYLFVEANGNASTFTLSNIRKNAGIPDGVFKVDLPKDTKIVRR